MTKGRTSLHLLINPTSDRHFIMYEAIRKVQQQKRVFDLTKVKTYFIEQMRELVEEEEEILKSKGHLPADAPFDPCKERWFL